MATTVSPPGDRRDRMDSEATGPTPDPDVPNAGRENDECIRLIERIAKSEGLQKSSRLPVLLRYLAECTLANNRAGLTEQAIGRAVFDKPKDFHPTEDSSVRVYVRQLRLRLHEYYQSVGIDEQIVIDIPKGGYALAFHPRHSPSLLEWSSLAPASSVQAASSVPLLDNATRMRRLSSWLPWLIAMASLIFAALVWFRAGHPASQAGPSWPMNEVFEPGRQTTMVLADGSYVLRLLGDREITLDQYADHHYADKLIPKNASEGELRLFNYLQNSQITSMADARAASAITDLAGALRNNLVIRSAKELNGNILTSGNFILVGARTSNPWAELYEDRVNFRLVEDGLRGGRYIENKKPRAGEEKTYSLTGPTGVSGDDYATISLVPGMGEQGTVLLLQGLRLEGTEAAIRVLRSEEGRKQLEQKLKAANGGNLPRYFEALLHAHSMGGSAASADCIAVRIVPAAKR